MTLTVHLPESAGDAEGLEAMRRAPLEAFVLEGVRRRLLSPAEGGTALGVNRWKMLALLETHRISLSDDDQILRDAEESLSP